MRKAKKIFKWSLCLLIIPVTYIIVSLLLTSLVIDRKVKNTIPNKSIYLSTNGIHLDIVIPLQHLDNLLLTGIKYNETDNYISFGWGDENFYLNTPTWNDLTFNNAFKALFLKSTTLMHVTRHKQKLSDWVEVKVNETELQKLNSYLQNTFETNKKGVKIMLNNKGYSSTDDFYKSKGSYSCFKTCNSWVNIGFKESGLKSCVWTPFDFGLLNKYK